MLKRNSWSWGEVDKPWFQNNFVGKRFVDDKGNLVGIKVVKGKADVNNIMRSMAFLVRLLPAKA